MVQSYSRFHFCFVPLMKTGGRAATTVAPTAAQATLDDDVTEQRNDQRQHNVVKYTIRPYVRTMELCRL